MAEGGIHPVRLYDSDGDALDDGSGQLKISFSDALGTDHFGLVGAGADMDGNVHGQLRYIGMTLFNIYYYAYYLPDGDWAFDSATNKHVLIGGVRNDTPISIADGNTGPIRVGEEGEVIIDVVDGGILESALDGIEGGLTVLSSNTGDIPDVIGATGITAPTKAISIAGTRSGGLLRELQVDAAGRLDVDATSEFDNAIGTDGQTGPPKCVSIGGTASGNLQEMAVTADGYVQVNIKAASASGGATDPFKVDTEGYDAGSAGIMPKVVCSDTLAALSGVTNAEISSLQVDTQGALYTTHGVTGITSGNDLDIGTASAAAIFGDTPCKRVDIMASPDNTGYIWIGGSNVAVNRGIRLSPGDFYSTDIDNVADIFAIASVDQEDIVFNYFT